MSYALRAENLSKCYRIQHADQRLPYRTLRDDLARAASAPWRWLRGQRGGQSEDFWALRDVSFEVREGEVLGIIGRNGAGKSTLLKILSRITRPTSGTARLRGRVGSLLEVGTGFHPELTGRENIFLSGAVLGMTRREVKRKFDEIVAFAEVERFLDTPAKRFSSGMYTRLGFAVAAHLDPEILLVDEVLAVGDASFQKKCLGKMDEVAHDGRTVLFVSHNMAMIQSLCPRTFLLNAGTIVEHGETSDAIARYLQLGAVRQEVSLRERKDRAGDGSVRIVALRVEALDNKPAITVTSRLRVTMDYESEDAIRHPRFLVSIRDMTHVGLYLLDSDGCGGLPETLPSTGTVSCTTGPLNVTPGRCFLNIALSKGNALADHVQFATEFDIETEDVYGTGKLPPRSWVMGVIKQDWRTA
jgi:lipopolysaccharide transport system ATP-binding protein